MVRVRLFVIVMVSFYLVTLTAFGQTDVSIQLGEILEGEIDPNASDEWLLIIEETQTITVDLRSQEFDTLLKILDPAGNDLAENDDWAALSFSRVPALTLEPGNYYIVVSASDGISEGAYTIESRLATDGDAIGHDAQIRLEEGLEIFQGFQVISDTTPLSESQPILEDAVRLFEQAGDEASAKSIYYLLGGIYYVFGDLDAALSAYDLALEGVREVNDPLREAYIQADLNTIQVTNLHKRGTQVYLEGQYDEALALFEETLTVLRSGVSNGSDAVVLNNMGAIYQARAEYDEALGRYDEALEIHRRLENPHGEAVSLSAIGFVKAEQGNYIEALDYHQQALDIRQTIGDQQGEAESLNNIGAVYFLRSQYDEALEYYNQAAEIARLQGDRLLNATITRNIAFIYSDQGNDDLAIELLQESLATFHEFGDLSNVADALHLLGRIHANIGHYGQELDYYQQALDINQQIGAWFDIANTLESIGSFYEGQGQYPTAIEYYEEVLGVRRQIGARIGVAESLTKIARIYRVIGLYDRAFEYLEEAMLIQREADKRDGIANIYIEMGHVALGHDDSETALEYFSNALEIAEANDFEQLTRNAQLGIANVYDVRGDAESTVAVVEDVWEQIKDTDNLSLKAGILKVLAGFYAGDLDNPQRAIAYYKEAIALQESLLDNAAIDSTINNLINLDTNSDPYLALTVLLMLQQDLEALEYAERGRAILLRDSLRNQPIEFRENIENEALFQTEAQLRLEIVRLSNFVNALRSDPFADNTEIQEAELALGRAHDEYNQHLEQMQLQGGFLARELALDVATLSEMQAALPEDTSLILYGISDYGTYALIITRNNVGRGVVPATTEQISNLLRDYTSDRETREYILSELYNSLFASIDDLITTTNLIISPQGILNYVPFAALRAPDGSYLIDHYTISNIPSGTVFTLLHDRPAATGATSTGLVLSQSTAPGFEQLQRADTEAIEVAAELGATLFNNATETDLRNGIRGSEVLHISAHVELNPTNPMFSQIYLAADEAYDGRLEVREVYELDLSHGTELVILSGCDTASGGTGDDFGLLTQAFLGAGANQVVASLWSVDDLTTVELISSFVANRNSDQYDSTAQALRAAMLSTRDSFPDPYYWASFVLIGTP